MISQKEVDISEAVLEGQVAVVVFKKAVDAIPGMCLYMTVCVFCVYGYVFVCMCVFMVYVLVILLHSFYFLFQTMCSSAYRFFQYANYLTLLIMWRKKSFHSKLFL